MALAGFDHYLEIEVAPTYIDAALTDFPLTLFLTETEVFTELASDANRKKIAVTTSDGETQCYVEIEYWSDADEEAVLHVKVPSISNSVATYLLLYYDSTATDNTTYVGDTGDAVAQSVWNSSFGGVWHLSQDPSGGADSIIDSTSNGIHGTPVGMDASNLVSGNVGLGIDFDKSDDRITLSNDSNLSPGTEDMTVFASFSTTGDFDATGGHFYSDYGSGLKSQVDLGIYKDKFFGRYRDEEDDDVYLQEVGSVINDGSHHVIAWKRDGTVGKYYLDGSYVTSDTDASLTNVDVSDGAVPQIGCLTNYNNQLFDGIIDEIRVWNGECSDAWIKATYYSLLDSLVTYSIPVVPVDWLSDWAYRRKFTVDNTKVDTALSSFPGALVINDSCGLGADDLSGIFSKISTANRKKIAVTTSDGTTQCYVEIENWDDSSNKALLHVKIPDISSSEDTEVYLYYDSAKSDNTAYVGDPGDVVVQSVWDSDFDGVWHMSQDPNGDASNSMIDSTSNVKHGTPSGGMTTADLVDALKGKGIELDGNNDCVSLPTSGFPTGAANRTVEVIANFGSLRSPDEFAYTYADHSNGKAFLIGAGTTNTLRFNCWGGGSFDYAYTSFTTSSSYHLFSFRYDGTDKIMWLDDAELSAVTVVLNTGNTYHVIGQLGTGTNWLAGIVAEVRVSSVVRSDAWTKATYYTLFDTFGTWGDEETYEGEPEPEEEVSFPSGIIGGAVKTVSDMRGMIGEVAKPIKVLYTSVGGEWKELK